MQFSGNGFSFPLGEKTYIMGIVNVTPDSFSDGGQYLDPERAVAHALRLQQEGADLIDIGAQSTRPGFTPVSSSEEWERLRAVLPECREPEDVPEPARRLAEEEGLPLADAYLRFLHRERQRAAEERERQRQAAARSSGPLAGERAEPQPEQEAFRRAFEKALW